MNPAVTPTSKEWRCELPSPEHPAVPRTLLLAPILLVAAGASEPPPHGGLFSVPAIEWAPHGYVCSRADTPLTIDGRLDKPA